MSKHQTRRNSPNQLAQSKVFSEHGLLLLSDAYNEYESAQQSMREGVFADHPPDDVELLSNNWEILDHLIELPEEGEEEAFGALAHSNKVHAIYQKIQDVWAIHSVVSRSIEFEAVKTKEIKSVLSAYDLGRPIPDLLTLDQEKHIRALINSHDMWVGETNNSGPPRNLWDVLLRAQREITDSGSLTDDSVTALEEVRVSRSGTKRPRIYSHALLIVLFAELFEDCNEFGKRAAYYEDRYQKSKTVYEADQVHEGNENYGPWSQAYLSKFPRFLDDVLGPDLVREIGTANASKITKNRKRLKNKRLTELIGQGAGRKEFFQMLELIDLVKG